MVVIEASVDISAPAGRVWGIISDLDSEPRYWKGTKEARTISQSGNTVRREVIIAFQDKKCVQEVTMTPEKSVHAEFVEGIIRGSKSLEISERGGMTRLEAKWDIRLGGAMGLFSGMLKRHIRGGTMQALEAVKKEAESAQK